MRAKRADEAYHPLGDQASCLGKIMGNIFTNAIRCLVKPTAKADEVTGVGQALQINEGNACRRQIPRTRDSPLSYQLEDAVSIGDGMVGHTAKHCHLVLSGVM